MRDGDLLLDLFGGAAGPLRDDLDVVVGDVGIGLDGQVVERDDAPDEQQNGERRGPASGCSAQNRRARESFTGPPCSAAPARSRRPAGPASMPESDLLHIAAASMSPPTHRRRAELAVAGRHIDPVAIMQVKHRGGGHRACGLELSCRGRWRWQTCRGASECPGSSTWMRTLAVRMLGIEHGADVADRARQNAIGIGVRDGSPPFWPRCTVGRSFS